MESSDILKFPILYVDDEPDNLDVFRFNFRKYFKIFTASSGKEGLSILNDQNIAIVVTDQRMPEMTGLEFLKRASQINSDILGIILTAYKDTDILIEAIRLGIVYRFITKPWNSEELRNSLKQAVEVCHLRYENLRLNEKLKSYTGYLDNLVHQRFDFGNIVGDSSQMKSVMQKIEKVAPTDSTVLIRGETGTGKELVAHAIHLNSTRSDAPFVKVNCAALSLGTLESELFGHEKGAFTGAVARRLGRFELADGGTIFLDEIGDLPHEIQVKLLRILQERQFERVGGEETLDVNVRIISATHKDLEKLTKDGTFRQDLYYRLNVFPIHIPPLRERQVDIRPLIEHFVDRFSISTGKPINSVDELFFQKLEHYYLPGNVRELENLVERAIILSNNGNILPDDLDFGPSLGTDGPSDKPNPPVESSAPQTSAISLNSDLENREKERILQAIEESGGNMAKASRILGINRSTLYYRLGKYDLNHVIPRK